MKKVLIFIIIIMALVIGFVCIENKELKNNLKNNSESTVNNLENVIKNEVSTSDSKKDINTTNNIITDSNNTYNNIINEYKNALEKYDIFDENADITLEKDFKNVDPALILYIKRYEQNILSYTFYDIDKNGIDELIFGVTTKEDDTFIPTSIYSNKNNLAEKLYFMGTIERGNMEIYDNGIIFDEGAGGAALHYYTYGKIAENGYSLKIIEKIEEEYVENNTTPIYRNAETGADLKYKNVDEINEKYINNAKTVKFKKINKLLKN